jgi:phosphopantetheinyl transferase
VVARREGFLLRRWTARRALAARLGLAPDFPSLATIVIRRDAQGAPTAWRSGRPLPVSMSLSDRAGRACCVVGPPGLALGCDLERVEPRSEAFVTDFLTVREQLFVMAAEEDERDLRPALLWSAKESALKALGVGLRRDTRSLEVVLSPPAAGETWSPLAVSAVEGRHFAGWWRRVDDLVLTVLADPPAAAPTSLAPTVTESPWARSVPGPALV